MFGLDFERFFMVRDGSNFFRVGVVRKGADKTRLNLNIDMLCMQELFFLAVGGLLETLQVMSTFIQKERRVLTRKRTKMSK